MIKSAGYHEMSCQTFIIAKHKHSEHPPSPSSSTVVATICANDIDPGQFEDCCSAWGAIYTILFNQTSGVLLWKQLLNSVAGLHCE